MFSLSKFFNKGLKDSLLFASNGAMSHNGPWKQVYTDTLIDRFHVSDFSSAEYTISVDFNKDKKEILKVLVTASLDTASVVIYARNNLDIDLVNITATVNNSYVDIIANPTASNEGSKIIYTVQYFQNQNPQVV
jgi:hypothetical protein|tara:strand:+ start:4357 stop:4758 length:402 start_codon:yes stop_codon:yes gene_type:complete